MPDEPRESDWSQAGGSGLYGLTLEELRLIIRCLREANEQNGRWLTATELRVLLRKPGG